MQKNNRNIKSNVTNRAKPSPMIIVGQISSPEEAKEMESIAELLVIGNRARILASKIRKNNTNEKN